MTRVVVVDDQALVRSGIRMLLELAGFEVVGEADDGKSAVETIVALSPDVVLMDLRMPEYDGIWALDTLSRMPDTDVPVLVLTTFDDDELVLRALRAGARGYMLKDVTLDQLTQAVESLAAGGTLIAPSITDRLLRAVTSVPTVSDGVESPRLPSTPLTTRELEVLRLMAEGYSNRQIAETIHLAEGTVKNHVSAILTKLDSTDRTKAVLRALREGVLR